jgi:hypothetical protein
MSFSDHQNSVKSFPQSPWNGISQTLDLKISRGSMPPDPPSKTRAFGPRFQPPQSQTASYGPVTQGLTQSKKCQLLKLWIFVLEKSVIRLKCQNPLCSGYTNKTQLCALGWFWFIVIWQNLKKKIKTQHPSEESYEFVWFVNSITQFREAIQEDAQGGLQFVDDDFIQRAKRRRYIGIWAQKKLGGGGGGNIC